MKTTETRVSKIKAFLTELNKTNCKEIDLAYFADEEQQDFNDLRESIQDGNGFDIEILYYDTAIEYLKENDSSLRESLNIASEMGFTLENLSSETLASLLAEQQQREEFEGLESEINEFFDQLNEEEKNKEN